MPSFFRSAISAILCIAGTTAFAQCNTNDTTAPCFANVPDILGGRQSVLQDDDLVVNGTFINPSISFLNSVADGRIGYTTNSQITGSAHTFTAPVKFAQTNAASVKGRMFNLKNDQVVTIVAAGVPAFQSANIVGLPGGVVPQLGLFANASGAIPKTLYGASGRFIGNGFDQMVFAAAQLNSPVNQIVLQAIGAANPNNPSAGIIAGAATAPINNGSVIYAMTSGIFTDPQPGQAPPAAQIALLSGNPANGAGLTLSLFSVTANLSIAPGPTLNLSLPGSDGTATLHETAIAAGRFFGGSHDQLVVAYGSTSGANSSGKPVELITIDFNSAGIPVQKSIYNTQAYVQPLAVRSPGYSAIYLRAGRFNWFGNSEQVAMSTFSYSYKGNTGFYAGTGQIQVLYLQQNSQSKWVLQSGPPLNTSGDTYHFSMAAGRFDQMQTDPTNPNATEPDPNLQLADFTSSTIDTEGDQVTLLQIYSVDPQTYTISSGNSDQLFLSDVPVSVNGYLSLTASLVAADIQGRSVAIGPPEKATVTGHIQPDLILGLPPMHVDWIAPAEGNSPKVLNLSVYPQSFNTAYSFEGSSTANASRTGTTSYTAATKRTIGGKISYEYPGAGGISVEAKKTFERTHKNVVAKKFNTYSGESTGFSTKTIFDDVVAASSSQMNIYSYRLIGQCAPAAGAAGSEGCSAGTRPLYVQFSGPDNLDYIKAVEGRNVEWYQPVQEPGNLFSYPANLQQLEADIAGGATLEPLTPTNNIWDSQVSSKFFVNWTEGNGNAVNSSSIASHSFDSQVSVSANAGIFGFDVSANTGFGYNTSSSVRTLNQSVSSLQASSGVTLNRGVGGQVANEAVYDYSGQSLIYGQRPPPGTIQSDIPNTAPVQAPGYITAAHTADMLSQGIVNSGNFWPQAYGSQPDLALNHPQRWTQHAPYGIYAQQVWFNCPVGFTSSGPSPSCTPNGELPGPASIADASFYYMKGLFATPGGATNGPQITSTALGQKVNLRARIYNYSLANFPAGTITHVQFYAQPWDSQNGQFTGQTGGDGFAPAIFIGEGTDSTGNPLAPVPAFCGGASGGDPCLDSTASNWEFAYTTWDTSKGNIAPNSTWKFWVVVWAEYNGALVSEISGHGLKSAPAIPFNSLADVPIETYSNNLGFYNQVFTVLGANNSAGASKTSRLTVSNLRLRSGSTTLRDLPVTITADHRSSGGEFKSVLALYYDGDPESEGTLFDTQNIDRVASDGLLDTARFTPKTCGVHRIFVRSVPQDGSALAASAETTIDVRIDAAQAIQSVDDLSAYLLKQHVSEELRCDLNRYLADARQDFKNHRDGKGRRDLDRFKEELHKHGNAFEKTVAEAMREQAEDILGCIPPCRGDDREEEPAFSGGGN
ncbi:hypothetical protein ACPOL_0894 [Acidisarcina polymorpha]|uniref:Uncharacterized protein n=1 Tax=Acidisarcina polymorpha TaxID=2211140 RepID=A0A2Z5FTT6_9BACT|nr:hypothetical protein [Acidisarcina polymorpha]AXC10251.1 hypothetical protein ACPOL_0894 [Acidisarcina polymorpha]